MKSMPRQVLMTAVERTKINEEDTKGLVEFEHQNIVKAKRRPFANSAKTETYPPVYLEANMPSLSTILNTRFLQKSGFRGDELTNLLLSVLYGLSFLQFRGIVFGDVHPTNIFYDQVHNLYKLGNPLYTYNSTDLVKTARRACFLSPERMEQLYNPGRVLTFQEDFKADVFTLGIHLLEAACMEPGEACYLSPHEVNVAEVERRLLMARQKFGEKFAVIVRECLELDVANRRSAIELAELAHSFLGERKRPNVLDDKSRINFETNS